MKARTTDLTHSAAFFDVDETLWQLKSMFSFLRYVYVRQAPKTGANAYQLAMATLLAEAKTGTRAQTNHQYYALYQGWAQADIVAWAAEWFEEVNQPENYLEPAFSRLKWHQAQGHQVVLISGACVEILAPLAQSLAVSATFGVRLEIDGAGLYTGLIEGVQTIGPGKAQVLNQYVQQQRLQASACYAYGDHITDVPMLEAVGHPYVVNAQEDMLAWASQRGVEVLT
ncbi:MAG: HAD family hydrolase [Neisseriaceae bacterium]|nr:HAD family hydrolase [Neisseriaceae bacterium]